jgi:hypothetical protein
MSAQQFTIASMVQHVGGSPLGHPHRKTLNRRRIAIDATASPLA